MAGRERALRAVSLLVGGLLGGVWGAGAAGAGSLDRSFSDSNSLCVVPLQVQGGKFTTPKGDDCTCAPGSKPVTK